MHTWPAFRYAAQAPPFAATCTSAATSAQTMNGSLPPISRFIRATRCAQAAATFFPVATEPVKATPSIRSSSTSAAPTSPAPATMFTTPGGSSAKQEASMRVETGVSSDGFATTVLPAASAGASFQREEQQRVVPRARCSPRRRSAP